MPLKNRRLHNPLCLELFRLDSVLWRPGLGVIDGWTEISMYAYMDRWTKHPVF